MTTRLGSQMARATPLQKPTELFKQRTVEADRGFNNHFEAGDPASVVEWRGRPRFKNHMTRGIRAGDSIRVWWPSDE